VTAADATATGVTAAGSAATGVTAAGSAATGGAPTLAELCVVACAEAWRGDGAILASPMGVIPMLGARLAQLTFEPGLLVTDGEATVLAPEPDGGAGHHGRITEGWIPFRDVFTLLAAGKRHIMMGASQLDQFGNQNISCIGPWARPKAQLIGVRGAPGNTVNHPVSYWVPRHSRRVFVEHVDMVSGVGYQRAAALSPQIAGFHELRQVVTNLAVLDFGGAEHAMRLRSVHPGVSVSDVADATGFVLAAPLEVPETRRPTAAELALIREQLDPDGRRDQELG
jgi:acyl CoA:acetate/3-ketoacid CoA transferase beta subunit